MLEELTTDYANNKVSAWLARLKQPLGVQALSKSSNIQRFALNVLFVQDINIPTHIVTKADRLLAYQQLPRFCNTPTLQIARSFLPNTGRRCLFLTEEQFLIALKI